MNAGIAVLLIDDDEDFCASARAFFGRKGIDLCTLPSPKMATALDFSQIRLVFLDIEMPGMTGTEVLRHIRAKADTSIIMISGHSDAGTRIAMLEGGADFFLPKPVNLEELYLVADRILARSGATGAEDGGWTLQRSTMLLITPDNRQVGLSASEFRVIEALIRYLPDHVAKDDLLLAMSGRGDPRQTSLRALEVMLSRLRSRASTPDVVLPIRALRNAGYVFHGSGRIVP